jgi:hypothetical protein
MLIVLGVLLNVFEAVDVIMLIKGGVYDDLNLSVGEALTKRTDVRCPCLQKVDILSSSLTSKKCIGFCRHIHMLYE